MSITVIYHAMSLAVHVLYLMGYAPSSKLTCAFEHLFGNH